MFVVTLKFAARGSVNVVGVFTTLANGIEYITNRIAESEATLDEESTHPGRFYDATMEDGQRFTYSIDRYRLDPK